ncbi:MAG: O-antigen ligase family protein [Gammaproteobacteria bacterium]|nr:O-antigen ligase family protein [Gammaproteobacteria bacterium]
MNKPLALTQSFISHIVHFAVFLYPVVVVTLPDAGPNLFGGLALLSLIVFVFLYAKRNNIREEKLLFFCSLLIFLAAMLTAYLGGFNDLAWQKINNFLILLMVIPLYFLFKRFLLRPQLVWWGLFFGVVLCGIMAIYESQWGSVFEEWNGRASGATHPILFADIALTMSFMLLVVGSTVKKWDKKYILAFIIIFSLGLTAVILSKFKGIWVVVPVLMLLMFWRYKSHMPRKVLMLFAVFIITVPAFVYLSSAYLFTDVQHAAPIVEKYADGRDKTVSVETRLQMWQASWLLFSQQPLAGAGWGHYIDAAQQYVDQGKIDSSAVSWNHPHNQFFSAMANGGLIMLLALLYFLLIPLDMFRRFVFFPDKEVQAYALAGLVLVVSFTGYAVSEAIFERTLSTGFYAFYLALFFALMYRTKQKNSEHSIVRNEKLSVIVIAYNEADRIEACLSSVAGWADEIIVLDNGSTDGTIDLAKKYSDKVFVTDWPGYGKQKQRALDKAQYEWVLSIDADEQVTAALKNEIDKQISANPVETGFCIPWQVMIYDKRIDFGHNGRAPLRLFRRELATFSDVAVHEKVLLSSGHIGLLNERLLHFTHRNLKHAMEKYTDYAWLWGVERFEQGKKASWRKAIINSSWSFLVGYVFKLGFLDGFRGLILATHIALYTFNKYAVLWTLQQQKLSAQINHTEK